MHTHTQMAKDTCRSVKAQPESNRWMQGVETQVSTHPRVHKNTLYRGGCDLNVFHQTRRVSKSTLTKHIKLNN